MQNSIPIDKLKETILAIHNLDIATKQAMNIEEQFNKQPTTTSATDCDNFYKKIDESFQQSIEHIIESISSVGSAIAQKKSNLSAEERLPQKFEVDALLFSFYFGKPKYVGSPIPTHCGCFAYKIKKLFPNMFICFKNNTNFMLMIIHNVNETSIDAYDPYDPNPTPQLVTLTSEQWTPLPVIIPMKPSKRWEFTRTEKVLALPHIEHSHIFYPATVIYTPADAQSETRGYTLDIEGYGQQVIPEQYVIKIPPSWL
ncbi:hypothetical protein TVAG_185350 [Trichomonas vaginalis G3]|uniref:SGF29 C-terminal domain-containing protein n=1 Tax=Trichomonas vaginalis (strain ATCC PRA-98 / G3) TaxID=412133 RepID=A2D8I0_TRIV3|nr:hypothetical protein TVAGG3_0393030 [Trichomonas vaginalis G3]EAY23229.1 hypothetical protein TVAG_185350 [Trichomonas vaginalis G3]KAI5534122.1 hypothetical protein TVAGG3_0393030 [Trichomonas vaginalis G3]|eukprot:XP_001584215.1 hypothetical protein [Trichomonas vaginalis G3]